LFHGGGGKSGVFDAGVGCVTPEWVLHSNSGCCIGTIKKSATYIISAAAERRISALRQLAENKRTAKTAPAKGRLLLL
jgi:hypothetical protein